MSKGIGNRSLSVVHYDVVNLSTAHQKYSFAKGSRFQSLKPTLTDYTTTLKSSLRSNISPSFGIGQRFTAIRTKNQTPPPDSYLIKGCFDGACPTIKGNTITTKFKNQSSREAHENDYVPGSLSSPREIATRPGPAHYSYRNRQIGTDAVSFSLKAKLKNLMEPDAIAKKQSVPGPGQYKLIGIDPLGKYILSTIPNSRAGAWSPERSKRFKEVRDDSPDPGTYNPSDTHSTNDNYILSKFKNKGCQIWQQHKEESTIRNGKANYILLETPGPGSYLLPGDFGVILPANNLRAKTPGNSTRGSNFVTSNLMRSKMASDSQGLDNPQSSRLVETSHGKRQKFIKVRNNKQAQTGFNFNPKFDMDFVDLNSKNSLI